MTYRWLRAQRASASAPISDQRVLINGGIACDVHGVELPFVVADALWCSRGRFSRGVAARQEFSSAQIAKSPRQEGELACARRQQCKAVTDTPEQNRTVCELMHL